MKKRPFLWTLMFFSGTLMNVSCSQKKDITEAPSPQQFQGRPAVSQSRLDCDAPEAIWYHGNYNSPAANKNSFSLRYFPGCTPRPLIIAFHGGGFIQGDKQGVLPANINNSTQLPVLNEAQLNNQRFAYATSNYTLLTQANTGVHKSLQDCQNFVNYMRAHAAEYNIDADRIILLGYSAGASASLWIGLREQPGIRGIVALAPQADLNILNWRNNVFLPYGYASSFDSWASTGYIFPGIPISTYAQVLYGTTNHSSVQTYCSGYKLNFLSLMDSGDPEVYLATNASINDCIHHACHVYALKQTCMNKALPANVQYIANPYYFNSNVETVMQFCVRRCM